MATIFPHIRKICLAHLPTKTHVCAKFCDHWSKTEEGVRSTRFSLYFSRNVPLPWQPFPHISEKYVLHIFPPRPMCVPSFVTIGQKLGTSSFCKGLHNGPPDRRPPSRLSRSPVLLSDRVLYCPTACSPKARAGKIPLYCALVFCFTRKHIGIWDQQIRWLFLVLIFVAKKQVKRNMH